jgi:hypothetical protein
MGCGDAAAWDPPKADVLAPVDETATVRVRDGEVAVAHGPGAGTTVPASGFNLLDCAHLDEAVACPPSTRSRAAGRLSCSDRGDLSERKRLADPAPGDLIRCPRRGAKAWICG